ncbi:Dynein heavy chain 9, axonemal [Saguinus oedipus]|uniref:Dynein heavy chain 9, axonemal n=1 Tax=Saguinus oedipus TaxID=9490 RepID=A0ABQ9VP15_SAGOE|nr:Dynein heavy chain 9, axonemal [Saguinus oedipus]
MRLKGGRASLTLGQQLRCDHQRWSMAACTAHTSQLEELTAHSQKGLEVQEAKVTEVKINEAREHYRPAAARASLLYFIMSDLSKIHPMYRFSLKLSVKTYPCNIISCGRSERSKPGEQLCYLETSLTVLFSLIGSYMIHGE